MFHVAPNPIVVCALDPHPPQSKTLRARDDKSRGLSPEFRDEVAEFPE